METKDMLKEVLGVYGKPLVRLIADLSGKDGQEVLLKYKGPLEQLLTNLAGENGEEVFTELKRFNRKEPCYATVSMHLESKMNVGAKTNIGKKINVRKNTGSILRCISEGENLVIRDLNGRLIISNAKTTFCSIDSSFERLGLNKTGVATLETPAAVHEIVKDATAWEIFSALPGAWNEKWLSQNQIIEFCEVFPDWLGQVHSITMFLIKKREDGLVDESNPQNDLSVVCVYVCDDGLAVRVYRPEYGGVWRGKDRRRVVSPRRLPMAK